MPLKQEVQPLSSPSRPLAPYLYDLDAPLLQLTPRDAWTARDAFEGTQIFGAIGSGKTSGSGATLAKAMLRAGWGGLVLCAKQDDRALWERYCAETGRSRSLIVFDAGGQRRFNFLSYEMGRWPDGQAITHNIVALLMNVLDAVRGRDAANGGGEDFWRDSMKELLENAIEPLWSAHGRIELAQLMDFVQDHPRSIDDLHKPDWAKGSAWGRTMMAAMNQPRHAIPDADMQAIMGYWTKIFANPDPRTSGNVLATVSAKLSPLRRGKMRELFATDTTILPELTHQGAVILLDFPVRVWAEAGILAQHIFKFIWQRAAETRTVTDTTRPLFLWADESQTFISPYDAEFQSTARSSRVATVYLTQNLPNYYNKIGGRNPHDAVDALLGNFVTKIFHANGDVRTNAFAADLIGKTLQWRRNVGSNIGDSYNEGENTGYSQSRSDNQQTSGSSHGTSRGFSQSSGRSWGASQVVDYQVQPQQFTTLRKGGSANAGKVDGIIVQGGRLWSHTRSTWMPVEFEQG